MPKSTVTSPRRYIWIPIFLLFLFLALGALRYAWLWQWDQQAEARIRQFGAEIAGDLVAGKAPDESLYRGFIVDDPNVAYLAIANFHNGYRTGILNASALKKGAGEISTFRRKHGDAGTLSQIIQPGAGFAGEYLGVYSVAFVPPEKSTDRTPMGVMKIGYIFPGFPYGRGFEQLWWGVSGLLGMFGLLWGIAALRPQPRSRPLSKAAPPEREVSTVPSTDEKEDLNWLEQELDRSEQVDVDDEGITWGILFNEEDLAGWIPSGSWYVSEGQLVGQPWGSSIVSTRASTDGKYVFRASARMIAGPDGFLVLFPCDGKTLAWVVGGWRNTRSEVAGYPATRLASSIERQKWYDLEVRVDDTTLKGLISGEKIWELQRSEVKEPSPDVGFQEGLGVAVWSTLARFRDFRFRTL